MCPDRKLQWFKERNYSDTDIKKIQTLVIKRWEADYAKYALKLDEQIEQVFCFFL
jgi:hypothetical protein